MIVAALASTNRWFGLLIRPSVFLFVEIFVFILLQIRLLIKNFCCLCLVMQNWMQNSIYLAKLIGKMHAVMSVAAFALITLGIVTQIGHLECILEYQLFCSSESLFAPYLKYVCCLKISVACVFLSKIEFWTQNSIFSVIFGAKLPEKLLRLHLAWPPQLYWVHNNSCKMNKISTRLC